MAAPIGLSIVTSNMEEYWSFYHLLFTPFADIALFLLNRKKVAMIITTMGPHILKCQMSKHLLCLQFISDIHSQVITDARLEYIRLRSESGTVQQETGNVSLSTQQWMVGYAGSLDIYLSRRWCNSRLRCTQLFNTTLPSFLK